MLDRENSKYGGAVKSAASSARRTHLEEAWWNDIRGQRCNCKEFQAVQWKRIRGFNTAVRVGTHALVWQSID